MELYKDAGTIRNLQEFLRELELTESQKIIADISPETTLRVETVKELGERERSDLPILIAEDSVLLNKLIVDSLKKAGYTNLTRTENGEEALKILDSNEIDLIILDIMMPKLDGIRATLKIREKNNMPIIISYLCIDKTVSLH